MRIAGVGVRYKVQGEEKGNRTRLAVKARLDELHARRSDLRAIVLHCVIAEGNVRFSHSGGM